MAGGLKRNETRFWFSCTVLSIRTECECERKESCQSVEWRLVWSDWICLSYEDEEEEENKMLVVAVAVLIVVTLTTETVVVFVEVLVVVLVVTRGRKSRQRVAVNITVMCVMLR